MEDEGSEVVEAQMDVEGVGDVEESVEVEDGVGNDEKDMEGVKRGWLGSKLFVITLVSCVLLSLFLGMAVFSLTDYESVQYGRYYSDDIPGVIVRVYLWMDGPFTDHKDVRLRYILIEGVPSVDIDGFNLTIDAHGGGEISCHFDGGYETGVPVWDVVFGECKDVTQFSVSGDVYVQVRFELASGVGGVLWEVGGGGQEGVFHVLPKADDDGWMAGRVAALGLVIGVSWAVVPNGVKTFRDILKGG